MAKTLLTLYKQLHKFSFSIFYGGIFLNVILYICSILLRTTSSFENYLLRIQLSTITVECAATVLTLSVVLTCISEMLFRYYQK